MLSLHQHDAQEYCATVFFNNCTGAEAVLCIIEYEQLREQWQQPVVRSVTACWWCESDAVSDRESESSLITIYQSELSLQSIDN